MESNDYTYSAEAGTNERMSDPIADSADHPADIPGPDERPTDTLVTAGATGHQGPEGVASRATSMLIDLRRSRKALDNTIQVPVDIAAELLAQATALYIYTDGSSAARPTRRPQQGGASSSSS